MVETRCRHGFLLSVVSCEECAADERRRLAARAIATELQDKSKRRPHKVGVPNPNLDCRPIPAEHRVALRGQRIVGVSQEDADRWVIDQRQRARWAQAETVAALEPAAELD
jgi:hypothetical protein